MAMFGNKAELERLSNELETANNAKGELEEKLNALNAEIENKSVEIAKLNNELEKEKAETETLKAEVEEKQKTIESIPDLVAQGIAQFVAQRGGEAVESNDGIDDARPKEKSLLEKAVGL